MPVFVTLAPALVALILIVLTRRAALALGAAVLSGVLLIHGGAPVASLRALFENHLFPALSGPWHLGPLLFTLTLGSFAALLEKSGGFTSLLAKMSRQSTRDPRRKLLFGIYGLGLLCFFDGLANAILLGKISRPLTDSLRVSRQFLAYLIDSTSSAVACVAFISTWIATQLSLIRDGLAGAPFEVDPTAFYFASIPANPYCLLTLVLLPLVIFKGWHFGPMAKAENAARGEERVQRLRASATTRENAARGKKTMPPVENAPALDSSLATSLIPLATLLLAIPAFIYLWQDGPERSWANAFSGQGVPYAMCAAGFLALAAAFFCFPKKGKKEAPKHALKGAADLIPALIILILAWSLGSVFQELGTAETLARLLGSGVSIRFFPLLVFLLGALTAFLTGSSWGTMGILMPLTLPLALALGNDLPPAELQGLLPPVIGAVFGGAVFGDHCSPFSDTTVVSALAADCSPASHVATQLPYALLTASAAALAYFLMGLQVPPAAASVMLAAVLALIVLTRKTGGCQQRPKSENAPRA